MTRQRPSQRRAFGSIVAIVLLAIASLVIVGLATPGADRAMQTVYAIDSVRAALGADAGVAVAAAAITAGRDIEVPAAYAPSYDLTFDDDQAASPRSITISARSGAATRVVIIEIE